MGNERIGLSTRVSNRGSTRRRNETFNLLTIDRRHIALGSLEHLEH